MKYSIGVPVMVFIDVDGDSEQDAKNEATVKVRKIMDKAVPGGDWDWVDEDYQIERKDEPFVYDWLGEQEVWEKHCAEVS